MTVSRECTANGLENKHGGLPANLRYAVQKIGKQDEHASKEWPKLAFGGNGEVFKRVESHLIEVWDWVPCGGRKASTGQLFLAGTLELDVKHSSISKFWPGFCNRAACDYTAVVQTEEGEMVVIKTNAAEVVLEWTGGEHICVLASRLHLVLGNNDTGELWVFDWCTATPRLKLYTVVRKGRAVVDLCGDWLALLSPKSTLTPVAINHTTRLLDKVLASVGKTTLDSLLALSKETHSCISKLYAPRSDVSQEHCQTVSATRAASAWLNMVSPSCDYPLILDLSDSSPQQICQFQAREGVSSLSLSPNDLSILTVSRRGDDICLWDFTHFTTSITLREKWSRGTTSGAINTVRWFSGKLFMQTANSNTIRRFDLASGNLDWRVAIPNLCQCSPVTETLLCAFTTTNDIVLLDGPSIKSKLELPTDSHQTQAQQQSLLSAPQLCNDDHVEIETYRPFTPLYAAKNVQFGKFPLNSPNWIAIPSNIDKVYKLNSANRLSSSNLPKPATALDDISICLQTTI